MSEKRTFWQVVKTILTFSCKIFVIILEEFSKNTKYTSPKTTVMPFMADEYWEKGYISMDERNESIYGKH